MQGQSFEEMLENTMKEIHVGEKITGKVISVTPFKIALNIGYKADGIITRTDYSNDEELDLTTVVKVGDELEVKVKKLNDGEGQVVLSRKEIMAELLAAKLKALYESGGIKKGKVVKITSGGLLIEVEPMVQVFMPRSLVSSHMIGNLEGFMGQELEFYIDEYNPIKKSCIADRKKIIVEEEKKKKDEALKNIQEGDIIEGTIRSILDYGVFVDVGGIDGLLHVTEMGWGRVKSPKKTCKVGDKIKVIIKEINGDKISLSAKFPDEDPWLLAEKQFSIGQVVKGKVVRINNYGAFVSLNEAIDGLLHISEISHKHIKNVTDALKIGDEIEVKVIDFDRVEKRVSLSMKALEPEPEKPMRDDRDVVDINIEEYAKHIKDENKEEDKK